ncbi:L-glutamate gamma-semialdehyde dehydrogenase [Amycolatopsis keratiniphila]|uniref:L-glutamate gamma-semialdehyde dehydrogenase n=1 Tax=Amycolatopsis keratiniphila subsp. keratiniphila TaxID=227715 RepID=A0A1W2LMZ2_9PSEU|nr:L-glutamate gamma-semialdehyde dehydrogenase [Amycolatopsis keratiniphila]OLZ53913.1 1-pyrroline-5-carboxylate dehydrogenase [Amycolatopsis keratiniphila subsp. nogabecina]ONF64144.1 1-pyrroline-5-carboxylate dehydrogenase [Amycolatopsis keratiniphila subsp. keratiniphila]SDU33082.1 delta-1-pyrroline-5-carboxylate dehydrogenase [Amycolatopsis keratiniphila]
MDAVTQTPAPKNEPVLNYAPGSAERAELEGALKLLGNADPIDITATIGGEQRKGGGEKIEVVQPHNHKAVLGVIHSATAQDTHDAIAAAKAAAPGWRALSFDDRAAIILRAADLLAGPWRAKLNAATMLGQSKTAFQAEIDSACELIDFWRFNVAFGRQILAEQPVSSPGIWNRMEHRPLEGFVYAITPFNFTAISGNLPTAPALMGNVVLWKPSPTQSYAAHMLMRLLEEAGMPPGVINLLPGDGKAVSEVALTHRDLAGIHFTGSTATFQHLWATVGANISGYRTYPRLVGETGGKDFVLAHASADVDVLRTALIRGAFEYQGQKCSAASRAYVPRSLWASLKDELVSETEAITYGDVNDLDNFGGAVIDRRAFDKHAAVLKSAAEDAEIEVIAGGTADDSVGYFVRPTILVSDNPDHEIFRTEYFGPILALHVYEDEDFDKVLKLVDETADYALTGAVIANDRTAVAKASEALRFAAGNFYVNDKPTGAVVGQQPFGGGRASGTNDKAGSVFNLLRWTSPRSVKETFVPPTSVRYPHQG